MSADLVSLKSWLEINKLSLNVAKTEFMVIGFRQRFASHGNHEIEIFLDSERVDL